MIVLLILAAVVLTPLMREYTDLRRSHGLSRLAAFGTTVLVLPAFGMATVMSLPLSPHPAAHWTATVVVTMLAYSVATRAILASTSRAEPAPSRRTTG